MSEDALIKNTKEYIIAHAAPTTVGEQDFLIMYKALYESWRKNGYGKDAPEWKELQRLNRMLMADDIWEREKTKRSLAMMRAAYIERKAALNEEADDPQAENAWEQPAQTGVSDRSTLLGERQTGKAVLWTVLFFLCQGLISILAAILLGIIAVAVSEVALLETILLQVLEFMGDVALPVAVGYVATTAIVLWLANFNDATERFFYKIVGIVLLVSQGISLVVNLIDGNNIWANIVHLGFGIRFWLMSRK